MFLLFDLLILTFYITGFQLFHIDVHLRNDILSEGLFAVILIKHVADRIGPDNEVLRAMGNGADVL